MNELTIDIEQIRQLAEEREEDNWTFRAIDCTRCANCCISFQTTVTPTEMQRLAVALELTNEEFAQRYTAVEQHERLIATCPCPLLQDNRCVAYAQRPQECRDFPHLLKKNIRSRMITMVQNASVCPIVFHTLERLKKEIPGWRSRRTA